MKMKTLFTILTLSSLTLTSCFEQTKTVVVKETSGGGGDAGGGGGWDNGGGGSNGGGTGGGTGSGTGFDTYKYTFRLAGGRNWAPYSGSMSDEFKYMFPTITAAADLFKSDSRLKVRIKLLPQESAPSGTEYCLGRQYPQAEYEHYYTKVKFQLALRDVICPGGNMNNCYLGSPYGHQTVGPISVNGYSPILNLGSMRNISNGSIVSTAVEISNVRSDNACLSNNTEYYCGQSGNDPYAPLKTGSCWEGTLEFATDYTKDIQ